MITYFYISGVDEGVSAKLGAFENDFVLFFCLLIMRLFCFFAVNGDCINKCE